MKELEQFLASVFDAQPKFESLPPLTEKDVTIDLFRGTIAGVEVKSFINEFNSERDYVTLWIPTDKRNFPMLSVVLTTLKERGLYVTMLSFEDIGYDLDVTFTVDSEDEV